MIEPTKFGVLEADHRGFTAVRRMGLAHEACEKGRRAIVGLARRAQAMT